MTVARYVGRHGGEGIDDSLPGPATIEAAFGGTGLLIDDPVSFPWHVVGAEDWRRPVTVDLRGCSNDDLVALGPALAALGPADRVVMEDADRRESLGLALPGSSYLSEPPADPAADLEARAPGKLRQSLRREVLEPILAHELADAGGWEEPRPLLVLEVGAADAWHAAFVPPPHRHRSASAPDELTPESAAIVLVDSTRLDPETLERARRAVVPGGLLVCLLDEAVVASSRGPTTSAVLRMIAEVTGGRHVVEHLWGLHAAPGAPTLGGVLAVRPLGGPS